MIHHVFLFASPSAGLFYGFLEMQRYYNCPSKNIVIKEVAQQICSIAGFGNNGRVPEFICELFAYGSMNGQQLGRSKYLKGAAQMHRNVIIRLRITNDEKVRATRESLSRVFRVTLSECKPEDLDKNYMVAMSFLMLWILSKTHQGFEQVNEVPRLIKDRAKWAAKHLFPAHDTDQFISEYLSRSAYCGYLHD